MIKNFEIIDNVVSISHLRMMQDLMTTDKSFCWFVAPEINSNHTNSDKLFYLTHTFYANHIITSSHFEILYPILETINPKSLMRIKGNLYPNFNDSVIKHAMHTDFYFPHRGAIFYINTNDGVTTFEDGTEIESVENRLLLFDSSLPHCSSTCGNQKFRLNINFNYF